MFRLAAILLGLLPFLLFELVLIGIDWKQPSGVTDPFVGFTEIRPLFILDGNQYKISDSRQPLFRPESFAAEKAPDEFRIFCIGGSTVQGRPFAIETAFSTWLEQQLSVLDSSKNWNAINCGGVSYASYRLTPILREVMDYEPDLIVLYTGHNEFLEDRTYESIKSTSPWVLRAHDRLSGLRSYSFLRSQFVGSDSSESLETLPADAEARLDFRGGLERYHRDDQWSANVARHFEFNLEKMVSIAQENNVPLILCNPVSNLRNAAPFKSQSSEELDSDAKSRVEELWSRIQGGGSANLMSVDQEIEILKELVELDPRRAEFQFRLGQAWQQKGDFQQARMCFVQAKDEDICPLRATQEIYNAIANAKNKHGLHFVDVMGEFESLSPDGIAGRELLLDHVHPSIHGHQIIGRLIVDQIHRMGMVARDDLDSAAFDAKITKRYAAHLKSLPFLYFESAKDRLAGLKRWAAGEVTREKGEPLK
jgi:lysophospholipase L1-like esterase